MAYDEISSNKSSEKCNYCGETVDPAQDYTTDLSCSSRLCGRSMYHRVSVGYSFVTCSFVTFGSTNCSYVMTTGVCRESPSEVQVQPIQTGWVLLSEG